MIAIVADNPNTTMHGLDEDQMSELMVQLGVDQAFAFDGSGSTELLAKLARLVQAGDAELPRGRPGAADAARSRRLLRPVKAKKKAKH